MKADFDERRDVWGPMISGGLRMMTDLIIKPLDTVERTFLSTKDNSQHLPNQFRAHGLGQKYCLQKPRFAKPDLNINISELTGYFNAIATDYVEFIGPLYRKLMNLSLEVMEPYISQSSRILDAGCGPGHFTAALSKIVPFGEVIGIDNAYKMLLEAKWWLIEHSVSNSALIHSSIENISDEYTNSFDIVSCFLSLNFFSNKHQALTKLSSMCADCGLIFIIEPELDMAGRIWNSMTEKLLKVPSHDFLNSNEISALLKDHDFTQIGIKKLLPGFSIICGVRSDRKQQIFR